MLSGLRKLFKRPSKATRRVAKDPRTEGIVKALEYEFDIMRADFEAYERAHPNASPSDKIRAKLSFRVSAEALKAEAEAAINALKARAPAPPPHHGSRDEDVPLLGPSLSRIEDAEWIELRHEEIEAALAETDESLVLDHEPAIADDEESDEHDTPLLRPVRPRRDSQGRGLIDCDELNKAVADAAEDPSDDSAAAEPPVDLLGDDIVEHGAEPTTEAATVV